MARKLVIALVLLLIAAAIGFSALLIQEARRMNTRSVDSLRTINTAQATYAESHPQKGFASSLSELGPSPGAELIDPVLASGRKSGYIFVLHAEPDSNGRITHYAVTARPEKYDKHSRSFFTDESAIQHFTTENRAATASDPTLN